MWNEAVVTLYEILSQHLPGGTEKTNETQDRKPGPHSAATFGDGLIDRLPFP
jgi:hypothetical protein